MAGSRACSAAPSRAVIAKPFGAIGGKYAGGYGQRALSNAASNVGSRAFEIGWERRTGQRPQDERQTSPTGW